MQCCAGTLQSLDLSGKRVYFVRFCSQPVNSRIGHGAAPSFMPDFPALYRQQAIVVISNAKRPAPLSSEI